MNIFFDTDVILDVATARELVLTVLPTDGKMVHNALYSSFSDFEDATQHFTALQIPADFILTRNTVDYKESAIPVRTPEDFIGGLGI